VLQLKSVVIDFYRPKPEELIHVAGKEQLAEDVQHIDPAVSLAHIRIARVVDDIFTVLTVVDENLRLKSLPKCVAESVVAMPATRLSLYNGTAHLGLQAMP